jgi:hypothetical protein
MNDYLFPFNTCEKPREDGIAQPYSAFFNVMTCCVIVYFLLKTKHSYSFLLLLSILIFEAFHVFSHMVHIPGPMQINMTHALTYVMNAAFFNAFYQYTHVFPGVAFLLYMFTLITVDIYTFATSPFVYYLATQSLIFISLLFYYYALLPKFVRQSIWYILALVIVVILLFLNETYNCRTMMSIYPHFPYHILIETVGILLFYVICSNFYSFVR